MNGTASAAARGSRLSEAEPPPIPRRNVPPFFGLSCATAGNDVSKPVTPRAEAPAISLRRSISIEVCNVFSSLSIFVSKAFNELNNVRRADLTCETQV